MFKFSQKNALSLFTLLTISFSTLANIELNDKIGLSTKVHDNPVKLFKVKKNAIEYIRKLEEKLSSTSIEINEQEREILLVEYAQSLMYYKQRHVQRRDPKKPALNRVSLKPLVG